MASRKRKIVAFHLYNDFSGSPTVLATVLSGLLKSDFHVVLVTSKGGVLDDISGENFTKINCHYSFSPNKAVTFLRYFIAQVVSFCIALRYAFSRNTIFYINTILPVGPALAGRLISKRVVYHYHENAFAKGFFYKTLSWVMQRLASHIICVSDYQASFLKRKTDISTIPNALKNNFLAKLTPNPEAAFGRENILMIASLKEYKGTKEFVELARRLPLYNFTLVVNDTQNAIDKYFRNCNITKNLIIYPRQECVVEFYNRASIVLNLSKKEQFIETFGMTVLEAQAAGLPVIVPTVGGIAELVEDSINGYKIDVADLDRIEGVVCKLLTNKDLYIRMAEHSLATSIKFNEYTMTDKITRILHGKD